MWTLSAIIWATKECNTKEPVKIAAAWGQKASFSGNSDQKGLDLGTVILPFEPLRAICEIEIVTDKNGNDKADEGDEVMFKVVVTNMGQVPIESNTDQLETIAGIIPLDEIVEGKQKEYELGPYTVGKGKVLLPLILLVHCEPLPLLTTFLAVFRRRILQQCL